jgi:hypothetical protein
MYGQKDKRVLTASLEKPLTLWDIVRSNGILRHQFHMLNGCAPYAQRPSAASMGLDEGRFPAPMSAERDPQPHQTQDDCLCTLPLL